MGQEVIAHEENQQHPIINRLFEVEGKGRSRDIKIGFEIFPQNGNIEKYEWFFLRRGLFGLCGKSIWFGTRALCSIMSLFTTNSASRGFVLGKYIFPQYVKVRFVGCKCKNNEISILRERK